MPWLRRRRFRRYGRQPEILIATTVWVIAAGWWWGVFTSIYRSLLRDFAARGRPTDGWSITIAAAIGATILFVVGAALLIGTPLLVGWTYELVASWIRRIRTGKSAPPPDDPSP